MVRLDLRPARRFPRALRAAPREILTTLRVLVVIALVEVLIRWIPLPRLARLLGVRIDLDPGHADQQQLPLDRLPPKARRQLRCTGRVADAWPFSRGPCLRRALVGGHLLHDHAPAVRIGVAADNDTFLAHAWLEIDGRPLETVTRFNRFERTPFEVVA